MTKQELLTLMIKYTEALSHNKPDELPLAAGCRATYEGAVQPLGSGEIWGLPRRLPYRQTFVDTMTNTVCFSGTVTNHISTASLPEDIRANAFKPQRWWLYFVRLQANEKGEIKEVEEIARPETAAMMQTTPSMMEPPRVLEAPIPEDERLSREEMIRIASLYWDGVQKLVDPNIVPFHPDAFRVECGNRFSDVYGDPSSVRTQYDIPNFYWKVIKRRYPIVDVSRGIVISMVHMIGRTPLEPTGYVTDIFKIESGMIKYVYAFHDWNIDFVDWEGIGPQTTEELDNAAGK